MTKKNLLPIFMLAGLGLIPSISACSTANDEKVRRSQNALDDCLSFPETGYSVCNSERGQFKSTFEKFGLAAVGYPLTDVYPDGKGDWYQSFERVDMNGNFGNGCEEGRACIAHLGRWDLAREGKAVLAETTTDCNDDRKAPRENLLCMPLDFQENNYHRNGGLEFYGKMLSRVYDNCPLYPHGILGQCFWTERAKVGRIYGRTDWEGEQLGRKKLELEGSQGGGTPPPIQDPIPSDPTMRLTPTTIYIPKDTPGLNRYAGGNYLFVCESGANAALVAQLKKWETGELTGDASVIIQLDDESWKPRQSRRPTRFIDPNCAGTDGGWELNLYDGYPSFLENIDLAGSFVGQISRGPFKCTSGFHFEEIVLDMKRFPISNGVLQKPAINITIKGDITSGFGENLTCSVEGKSPLLWFQAGVVPIAYEVFFSFEIGVKVSKSTKIQATMGTEDGVNLWLDSDPAAGTEFEFTPGIKFGATFYKTLSVYAGLNMPISATLKTPCTPEYKLGLELVGGAEVGGSLPIGTILGAEFSTELFPPKVIRESRCQ